MNVLLLTSTINPAIGIPHTSRLDPKERENDYMLSLSFYINQIGNDVDYIVFGENSFADLSALKSLVGNKPIKAKVEFISFNGLDHDPACGKGYGEFKLVDYVMKNSEIINSLKPEDNIWKITGRYTITNIAKLIRTSPSNFDIYCNLRNYPVFWMDMYLLVWKKDAYNTYLKEKYKLFCESLTKKTPEAIFRRYLESTNAHIVSRFIIVPDVKGIRGWNNKSYHSFREYLKYNVRKILNFLIPKLWI